MASWWHQAHLIELCGSGMQQQASCSKLQIFKNMLLTSSFLSKLRIDTGYLDDGCKYNTRNVNFPGTIVLLDTFQMQFSMA